MDQRGAFGHPKAPDMAQQSGTSSAEQYLARAQRMMAAPQAAPSDTMEAMASRFGPKVPVDPVKAVESANIARSAGITPEVPKGQWAPGRQAPVSGHTVHSLAKPDAHPDLHATIKAAIDAKGGKVPMGPEMQVLGAAAGYTLSPAQSTKLSGMIKRQLATEKAKMEALKYAMYQGKGAKRALGGT